MQYLKVTQENVHGHKKKIKFFIERIKKFIEEKKLSSGEIKILDVDCGKIGYCFKSARYFTSYRKMAITVYLLSPEMFHPGRVSCKMWPKNQKF